MEKTITIDGRDIRFKTNGATPMRYKAQFKRDLFKDILKMASLEQAIGKKKINVGDFEVLDFEVFYNVAWLMSKTADPNILDPIAWLETFVEFPLVDVMPDLQELMSSCFMQTKKKI